MKKFKFPILFKVILAGLLVSFVASGASILISYSNQVKVAKETLATNLNNALKSLDNYYNNDTNLNCLEQIKTHVKSGSDITKGYDTRVELGEEYALDDPRFHNNFNEFETYYKTCDNYIYDNGFGFFPGKAEFQGKYVTLTSALLSAKISANGVAAYCAYPEGDNRIVFLGDSRQIEYDGIENPPFYQMAGSYYEFKEGEKKPTADIGKGIVKIYGKTTRVLPVYSDTSKQNLMAFMFIEFNESSIVAGVNSVLKSEITILAITSTAIVLIYALISYFLFIKNINKLSKASRKISKQLENNLDSPTIIDIKSHDEMATLAASLDALQIAVHNYADLVKKEASEREKMNAELEVASKIQLEALPPSDYVDEKVLLKAYIQTAKEVGGDFYDYFYIDESRFAILIADVSGKGIPASLFMMRSKAIIKNEILSNDNLEDAIYKANNILVSNNKENLFVTAFIGVVDLKKNEMTYVNSGHEKPYIVSKGKVNKLEGTSNFVIGEIENFEYKAEKVKFNKDDLIFMFTDGLNESINKDKEEFGYQRIENILAQNSSLTISELIKSFNDEHNKFIGEEEPFDDITMLVFKNNKNELHLEFDKKDYSIIEEATNKFYETYSYLDESTKAHVGIVLDELLNNQISYEEREDLKIILVFKLNDNALNLKVTSNGIEFNPFIDLKDKKKNNEIGGHGISIVKSITKKQSYKYSDNQSIIELLF